MTLAQAVQPNAFDKYGIAGLVLVATFGAIGVMWKFVTNAIQRERQLADQERQRGDEWQREYVKLSETMRERNVVALEQATRAIEAATQVIRRGSP